MKELEHKYLVLKLEDIYKYLPKDSIDVLDHLVEQIISSRLLDGKEAVQHYLCIRDSWPEYEPTLKLLLKD